MARNNELYGTKGDENEHDEGSNIIMNHNIDEETAFAGSVNTKTTAIMHK